MDIEEIAKRIAELHYPNKPNAIIDEPYRQVRMETLRKQVESELKNCSIPAVIASVCACTNFRETPMINGKHICSICNKPICTKPF